MFLFPWSCCWLLSRNDGRVKSRQVGLVTKVGVGARNTNIISSPRVVRWLSEGNALDEFSFQSDLNETLLLEELTSPEMVLGMSTLSEVATVDSAIVMSQVEGESDVPQEMNATYDTNATAVNRSTNAVPGDLSVTKKEKIPAPTVSMILKFAIPAIGVWLCSPLLSMIDTSAVGLLSGTAQQAALNPAVAVTEYTALLIAFIYTGTTNLVASASMKDEGKTEKNETIESFIAALKLSGAVGAFLGTALFALAVPLLNALIGNKYIDPEVFAAALKYVRIRALGMPAAAIIGASQAACLGMQDIKSPLYVLIAASVVNFLGDMVFVPSANPWIGGAAGAAWATSISQYTAVALFVQWLCLDTSMLRGPPGLRLLANRFNKYSTRGLLIGKFRGRHFFKFPSGNLATGYLPYLLPVTSTQVGRVSSYVAMSHVVASTLGTTNMAAQQVILSIWNCLYPVGESLSLTAQSFTPKIFERAPSPARTAALRQTLVRFWKAGLIMGFGLLGAVMCIPLFSRCFTTDETVIDLVKGITPMLMVIFSTLGLFTSSEGMILGQKDLGFLGKSYASFFVVVPLLMLRLKRAAISGSANVTLSSVWTLFTCYQLFRTLLWLLRASILQNRNRRSSE